MGNASKIGFRDLCEAVREGKVVFWVGAGFSEYAGYPNASEFTKYLQNHLGIPENEDQLLSEVSEKLSNREELLTIIKSVFGKESEKNETHKSLALLPQIPYIITTNYDMLFEVEFGDRICSFGDEGELPKTAGNSQKTFIYKIHGDIYHLDRIIITSQDYLNFDENSLLWGKIKTILAEYTIVFIGYSLRDKNVQKLLELILKQIGKQKNPYYFITKNLTDEKRDFLQNYDIIPIEIEGNNAINQIKEYVAKYAFGDFGNDPVLLTKNSPLLKHKGVKISSVIEDGKIRECTVDAIPNSGVKSIAMSQKLPSTPDSKEVHEWFDLIDGVKFDPVTVADPWSKFKLEVQTGDVFILNPNHERFKLETITLKAQPKLTYLVDLQINDIRFSNVTVEMYESKTHVQFVYSLGGFSFSFNMRKIQPGSEGPVEFGFSTENLHLDIDAAVKAYTFIKKWFEGCPIHVIRTPNELSHTIEPLPLEDIELYRDIEFRQKLFEILSDIQKISKIKLIIPDEITGEDLQKAFEIGEFLHGKKIYLENISSQITPRSSDFFKNLKSLPPITIEGIMYFTLLNQKIPLKYIIEGTNWTIENYEDVISQAEQDILPLKVVLLSRNNDLFLRFKSEE